MHLPERHHRPESQSSLLEHASPAVTTLPHTPHGLAVDTPTHLFPAHSSDNRHAAPSVFFPGPRLHAGGGAPHVSCSRVAVLHAFAQSIMAAGVYEVLG